MTKSRRHCLCAAAAAIALIAGQARAELTAEQVDRAVERGVQALLATQQDDGGWGHYPPGAQPGQPDREIFIHGFDMCGLMGLAYGELPVTDARLQKALDHVLKVEIDRNYVYAVRVIALSRLYPRLRPEQQELVKERLKADVTWLFKAQSDEGDWNYHGTGYGELSNTQMALLALYEATNVLRELPTDVWKKALDRYLKTEREDGAWNYGSRSQVHVNMESYGSMTAAAVASLFIIRDKLYPGTGCPCRSGKSTMRGQEAVIDAAIARGTEWLGPNFAVDTNPHRGAWRMYWYFSCERVGLASGIKYFGTHDWYKEMAAQLVATQAPDGSWGMPSETALAIAFLVKGRAPILMNKLQFAGQWNNHPRDAANLCKYLGKQKEQAIQWQVINLDVPVAEWHDAPILYISAETPIELTDEHKKKLREFTDSGGTILMEASCGNRQVILWWNLVCKEVWPEWEMKLVDRKHPMWTADVPITGRLPNLLGMSDGMRTFMFYSKADISCAWNTEAYAQGRVLFDLGGNLYMYTTDKGKLRARLARRPTGTGDKYGGQTPAAGPRKQLAVARIKHGGEWYLGDNYHPWQLLAADLQAKAGVTLSVGEPVVPGGEIPAGVALLHYSGRKGSSLGEGGGQWLRRFVEGGGFLLAEAALGDAEFGGPLQPALRDAGLTLVPLADSHPIVSGQMGGATGYGIAKVDFSHHLQAERIGKPSTGLQGIYLGDRLVGVYAPFDLVFSQTGASAYGIRGYAADDARAIATNIVLYLTASQEAGK